MDQQLCAIVSSGYYFLCVYSVQGFDQINPYAFTVKYSDTYDSGEPDDNLSNCKPTQLPIQASKTIDNAFDTDWIEFSLNTKKNIDLNFQNTTTTSAIYAFDLFDSNLTLQASGDKSGDNFHTLQPGTYFLRVTSETGFDKNIPYSIKIQEINVLSIDANYNILYKTLDGKLNLNGKQVDLNWHRDYYFAPPGGGYTSRNQSITYLDGVTQILGATNGTYSSNYTGNVKNAFIVRVTHVQYMYWYTKYYNGGPLQHSQTDLLGEETPRQTDISSSNPDYPMYLIIDATKGTVIDFCSTLNFYYGTNIESHTP